MIPMRVAAWGAAAALALLAGCRDAGRGGAGRSALTATARRMALEITVRGSGDIRSRNSNKLIPQIRRSTVVTFLVPEGTLVSSNDVVIRLNTDEVERRIRDLEGSCSDAQGRLRSAETEREIQNMDNATALKKAEQDLQTARMQLEKFLRGDEPMERRTAVLKVQTAESERERKQKRHEELQALLREGFVTQDEVDEARLEVESAAVGLDTARIETNLLDHYTLPLKRTEFEMAVAKAVTELEKTTRQIETRTRTKEQDVEAARRALERQQEDLTAARRELGAHEVRAPSAGVVTYGDPDESWRRGEIQVGGNIQPGQVLMTIPDMSAMMAVVNVAEADVHRVRAGQRGVVTVEALQGRAFPAEVTRVAEVANAGGWWSSDVKEFRVEMAISNGISLKPGFSCTADVVTEQIAGALVLPVQAVFAEGQQYVVYAEAGGGGSRVEVTVGRSTAQYAEILGGIAEGTRVLLAPPAAAPPAAEPPARTARRGPDQDA